MSIKAKDLREVLGSPPADAAQAAVGQAGEIVIDQGLLAQAVQMKNARLIASMVHENALLEVALEQERRGRLEAEAQRDALKAVLESAD